jgi:hypothetical protein
VIAVGKADAGMRAAELADPARCAAQPDALRQRPRNAAFPLQPGQSFLRRWIWFGVEWRPHRYDVLHRHVLGFLIERHQSVDAAVPTAVEQPVVVVFHRHHRLPPMCRKTTFFAASWTDDLDLVPEAPDGTGARPDVFLQRGHRMHPDNGEPPAPQGRSRGRGDRDNPTAVTLRPALYVRSPPQRGCAVISRPDFFRHSLRGPVSRTHLAYPR